MKKRILIKLSVLLLLCFGGLHLRGSKAGATERLDIADWDEWIQDGISKEFSFHAQEDGCLVVDLEETFPIDDYSICIEDSMGIVIYDEQIDWDNEEDCSFELELSKGDYTITFYTEGEVEFSVGIHFEYELPGVKLDDPIFELNKDELKLYAGDSAKLAVISDPPDAEYAVKWISSNKKVATVDQDGWVYAKKAGNATISAKVNGEYFDCVVKVMKNPPTYKEIYSILKKKKGKNFTLKVIDAGKKCRLYAVRKYSISDDKLWYSRAYIAGISFKPYIELVKKKDKVVTKFCFLGRYVQMDYFNSMYFEDLYLKFITPNRRLTYGTYIARTDCYYDYKSNCYVGAADWKAIMSSNTNITRPKLNKFEKMLGQSSFSVKIADTTGASFKVGINKKQRNIWKSLLKTYKQILKKY
ncbi:MAG: Ig-like domain-containing protein [Lachnospiraceae bacterium]|nr:Ig-like domain-containing protein [Lachnospiraceae bacterium]